MSRLEQLVRYISNVFHVPLLVKGVADSRDRARIQIETSTVLLAWIMGFFARVRSREELGRLLDSRAVQKLIGCHISSDTLGRVLNQVNSDSLRTTLLVPSCVRSAATRPGTAVPSIRNSSSASTAASPFAPATSPVPNAAPAVTEYYHQAVWAFIVGTNPRIYLDVEPLQPGEGEPAAAIRLVTRLVKHYSRWIDGVVADANFAGAPFLNHVRSCGCHYIVRVKDEERRHLTRDASGLAACRTADLRWTERVGHHDLQVAAWDEEGFTSWDALAEPTRVVVCDETELAQDPCRRRKAPLPERQRPRAFFATSYPRQVFPTHEVWLAYHRRWDIENNGFRQLKHEWHWDHPFVDTPAALLNLWLLLAVAANLFIAFVCRRLKSGREERTPWRTFSQEIAATLQVLSPAQMPRLDTG